MDKFKRISALTILITSIIVFYIWEITQSFDIASLTKYHFIESFEKPVKLVIAFLCSYGFYNMLFGLITKLFIRIPFVKMILLSPMYLDGTWAGFYLMHGQIRLALETYNQSLFSISCSGEGYLKDGSLKGSISAKSVYIDESEKKIIAAYTDNSTSRERAYSNYGYFQYTIETSHNLVPVKMHGFFFELGMEKVVYTVFYKVPRNVTKRKLQEIINFCYEKYESEAVSYLSIHN